VCVQKPKDDFECAAWPDITPTAMTSQVALGAWIETRMKPAWQDCKERLKAAGSLGFE